MGRANPPGWRLVGENATPGAILTMAGGAVLCVQRLPLLQVLRGSAGLPEGRHHIPNLLVAQPAEGGLLAQRLPGLGRAVAAQIRRPAVSGRNLSQEGLA
ncbi:MAG: hypothetical protein P8Z00_00725 [Anaerolineales bacterium]